LGGGEGHITPCPSVSYAYGRRTCTAVDSVADPTTAAVVAL